MEKTKVKITKKISEKLKENFNKTFKNPKWIRKQIIEILSDFILIVIALFLAYQIRLEFI